MRDMTPEEIEAFLLTGTRTGKLATVRGDGRPHVVPVWFILRDDHLVFNTHASSVKAKNMRREPRVAVTVDDQAPPYSFVTIEGRAGLTEGDPDLVDIATRIGGRYMGADRAGEYGSRNGVPGELVVRVSMDRVISALDVSD
jgi:PPOX class probable F420-dependent enzyme